MCRPSERCEVHPKNRKSIAQSKVLSRNPTRLAVTLAMVLAFALQSFIVQVHIHGAAPSNSATMVHSGKTATQNKLPALPGDDQTNCPICQEILLAGHYVMPAAVAWAPVIIWEPVAAITRDIAAIAQAYSHDWKSRAPPRA